MRASHFGTVARPKRRPSSFMISISVTPRKATTNAAEGPPSSHSRKFDLRRIGRGKIEPLYELGRRVSKVSLAGLTAPGLDAGGSRPRVKRCVDFDGIKVFQIAFEPIRLWHSGVKKSRHFQ